MTYRRRILRYGPQPGQLLGTLSERVIAGGWFELLRQGGCGRAELTLSDRFALRSQLQVGEWIAWEYEDGERWYLGRIEQRRAHWPAGITLSLRGMSAQLEGVFPGGFAVAADGRPPHRYAVSDRFPHDPDHARETVDAIERPEDVVRLLLTQYVVPQTNILYVPERIEDAPWPAEIISLKFHGEDAVAAFCGIWPCGRVTPPGVSMPWDVSFSCRNAPPPSPRISLARPRYASRNFTTASGCSTACC